MLLDTARLAPGLIEAISAAFFGNSVPDKLQDGLQMVNLSVQAHPGPGQSTASRQPLREGSI